MKNFIYTTAIACGIFASACKNKTTEIVDNKMETAGQVKKEDTVVIDSNKITKSDFVAFSKTLKLQNITYNLKTVIENGKNILTVQPSGLKEDNSIQKIDLLGQISNAEIEDLDHDGFPEVVIFVAAPTPNDFMTVIAFSPNKGKSLSQANFPSCASNPKINNGNLYNEEMALVESNLVQRFKLYKVVDGKKQEAGKTRQIQYKLKNGETSKQFVVDKILEF